mmetsp:Transcript_46961/g.102133  ORF Transcript_46961/g.102133 Transcript_46961/m.102133 type:complete len:238 (-) Transcript_46961:985-1698(-)
MTRAIVHRSPACFLHKGHQSALHFLSHELLALLGHQNTLVVEMGTSLHISSENFSVLLCNPLLSSGKLGGLCVIQLQRALHLGLERTDQPVGPDIGPLLTGSPHRGLPLVRSCLCLLLLDGRQLLQDLRLLCSVPFQGLQALCRSHALLLPLLRQARAALGPRAGHLVPASVDQFHFVAASLQQMLLLDGLLFPELLLSVLNPPETLCSLFSGEHPRLPPVDASVRLRGGLICVTVD